MKYYEIWKKFGEEKPNLCYLQIDTVPSDGAKEYADKKQLEEELSSRFSALLENNIKAEVQDELPFYVAVNLYHNSVPVVFWGRNFMELKPLREAVEIISKYGIEGYEEYVEPEDMDCLMKLTVQGTEFEIMRYGYSDDSTQIRNVVPLNKNSMRRLANAVGERFYEEGKVL